ncbi:PREDICTED: consortin [Myotis brandtii]|uniref:consortin n=1 Tax=Myotis brandtii TaxID=109478 RepID=UPI000704121A|nr:PREDICTED: consortin [Myotis brandtii]
MDDSEPPAGKLQIEPQDGRPPGGGVESVGSRLPSASDENENRLDGCGHDRLTSSDGAMGNPAASEQDSLNNNAGCTPSCEAAASATSENTACEGPEDGQDFSGKDENIPGKRSPRTKTGTARKIPPGLSSGDSTSLMQEDVLSADACAVGEEESAEGNANDQPEAPTLALQSLFSLIRGEVEQLDSRALPLCLHQIAESYFQDEDYEKAMKFIQLERLYHERLLANLSAIQEQWETKWKTVQPRAATSPRNSEKGFNGEDFERLTKFCATHQDPLLSKSKTAAAETALGRESFAQSAVSEGPQGSGAAAEEPERGTCPGMEPSGESQQREETPGSGEDDPDLLPDLSPDEASYSLQDDPPSPSDGSLSLDDLARRIEVAEVVPAAGLVSILKKRNDAVGDHPAQMQQKPPKRRVRFQEIDDNLDQDEAGSGSCILLVLLCVATVLLSVGGTALYCAFGDLDSPVCTDFADNVDFYYTKLLRGVAELKHWVRLS